MHIIQCLNAASPLTHTDAHHFFFHSFFIFLVRPTQCQKTIKIQICISPLFHNKNNCIFAKPSDFVCVSRWLSSIRLLMLMRERVVGRCCLLAVIYVFRRSGDFTRANKRRRHQAINFARPNLYAHRIYIMHVLHSTCSDTGYGFAMRVACCWRCLLLCLPSVAFMKEQRKRIECGINSFRMLAQIHRERERAKNRKHITANNFLSIGCAGFSFLIRTHDRSHISHFGV